MYFLGSHPGACASLHGEVRAFEKREVCFCVIFTENFSKKLALACIGLRQEASEAYGYRKGGFRNWSLFFLITVRNASTPRSEIQKKTSTQERGLRVALIKNKNMLRGQQEKVILLEGEREG